MRVFAVDDEPVCRMVLAGCLESHHKVVLFDDPSKLLAAIRSEAPDIVITDGMMPEISGQQLLVAIRRVWPLLPVVLVTSEPTDFANLDFNAVVLKPRAHVYADPKNETFPSALLRVVRLLT